MSDTFTPLTGLGTGGVYDREQEFGYQSVEKIRQALNVLGYVGGIWDLGGSDDVGVLFDGSPADYQPVRGPRDYSLKGSELGGLTCEVVVYTRLGATGSPAPTMNWRLRNTTDSSNAATGTAHDEVTIQKEVKTVTLAADAKDYRLEFFVDDPTVEGFAYGYLRFRKVPA